MKTTFKIAAAAAAVAMAMGANAASVTLYGSISTGLVYKHTPTIQNAGGETQKKSNDFGMESAWYGDSIWGLTGEEELGNGWKVGFVLENEYKSDTGEKNDEDRLFDSQAYVSIGNDTFKLAAGRLGGLASAGGDFDLIGGFDPLEAAFGVGGMGAFSSRDKMADNTLVAEVTPIDGLKVSAMASLGDDSDDNAKWHRRGHYYGLGALYENGPLAVGAVVEARTVSNVNTDEAGTTTKPYSGKKTGYTYTLGASWDFDMIKPMFMYQHTQNGNQWQDGFFGDEADGDNLSNQQTFKADSFLLGFTAPLGEGTLMASAQYLKAKDKEGVKGNATILGVAYNYELSKRTSIYCGATWADGSKGLDKKANTPIVGFDRGELNGYAVGLGLNHTF
ncbi:MAG: porin [Duodenibacillus sp.]|nr:porin [Duodenibacillus sp.]